MPTNVLTSDTASAPPSAAALAIGTMSVTFGVSLAMSGRSGQTSRQRRTMPLRSPPGRWRSRARRTTFGHDRFSSSPASPARSADACAAIATNSSSVLPAMLPMIAVGSVRRYGRWWAMKWSMPSLSRPMALSMPDGVSTVRGGGLPARGGVRDGLGDDAAELREVDERRHLARVAERAGRDQDRVAKRQPAERDRQVGHRAEPLELEFSAVYQNRPRNSVCWAVFTGILGCRVRFQSRRGVRCVASCSPPRCSRSPASARCTLRLPRKRSKRPRRRVGRRARRPIGRAKGGFKGGFGGKIDPEKLKELKEKFGGKGGFGGGKFDPAKLKELKGKIDPEKLKELKEKFGGKGGFPRQGWFPRQEEGRQGSRTREESAVGSRQ